MIFSSLRIPVRNLKHTIVFKNICWTALRASKVVLQLCSEQVNIPTMREKAQNMSVNDVELPLQWTKYRNSVCSL